jgi:hypothetical protein
VIPVERFNTRNVKKYLFKAAFEKRYSTETREHAKLAQIANIVMSRNRRLKFYRE